MRAVARRLDERALLDPRPGRTADELAAEAGRLLPELAADLRAGARIFDDVAYGSVRADAARAEQLRRLDERVEAAKPVVLAGCPVSVMTLTDTRRPRTAAVADAGPPGRLAGGDRRAACWRPSC